jgi:peptidoglycan/xylan/chitin deacetylase (PgdA/CDA1 family)
MRILTMSVLTLLALGAQTTTPTLQFDRGGIVRGDVNQKRLSLIFTGGDYAEGVPTILKVCREQGVPAHFFVTGGFLRQHADAARAIVDAGHLLGPHSDGHLLYCDWADRENSLVTRAQFTDDLKKNLADLNALGAPPSRYFVPPFEWYNADQVEWSRELGLKLINFTPGSGSNRDYIPESDPKFLASAKLKEDILSFEATSGHGLNGFILLLHAGSQRKDKAHDQLESLVGELKRRGYEFVTLDRLLGE